jgi:hypothetical protein
MFGNMIIGSSSKGVCHLMFYQDIHEALRGLQQQFPNAQIIAKQDRYQEQVKNFLAGTKGYKEGLTFTGNTFSISSRAGAVEYTEWGTE